MSDVGDGDGDAGGEAARIDPKNVLGAEVAAQMEAIENDFGDEYRDRRDRDDRRSAPAGRRRRAGPLQHAQLGRPGPVADAVEKALEAREG